MNDVVKWYVLPVFSLMKRQVISSHLRRACRQFSTNERRARRQVNTNGEEAMKNMEKLACIFVQYSRIHTPHRAFRLILWLVLFTVSTFLCESACEMAVAIEVCKARRPATQSLQYLLMLRFSTLPGYSSGILLSRHLVRLQPTEWTDPQLHSARAH